MRDTKEMQWGCIRNHDSDYSFNEVLFDQIWTWNQNIGMTRSMPREGVTRWSLFSQSFQQLQQQQQQQNQQRQQQQQP